MPERVASPGPNELAVAADGGFGAELVALMPQARAFLSDLRGGGAKPGMAVDDLVQETLTRAWRSRAAFDAQRGAMVSWLLRIAFRTFLDSRERGLATSELVADPVATGPGPEATAAARERTVLLLGRLEERERHLLLRFHRDGRSIADLAIETGSSPGTIKSLLHRARARLWQIERRQETS
ncbi:MAG: sigma-70 family RNA polymerase sigma factor [Planctomycetes bacterium]|nr:sigma-70 family RNA polymerase sigma factor [Planctomycetota bacterium]